MTAKTEHCSFKISDTLEKIPRFLSTTTSPRHTHKITSTDVNNDSNGRTHQSQVSWLALRKVPVVTASLGLQHFLLCDQSLDLEDSTSWKSAGVILCNTVDVIHSSHYQPDQVFGPNCCIVGIDT